MPQPKRKRRPPKLQKSKSPAPGASGPPLESAAAEAITVAWTASVTAVFLSDLLAIAAVLYARSNPESKNASMFVAIILFTACVLGLASLALLPVAWHVRQVRPPLGFAVFAGTVAVAPALAVAIRILS